MISLDIRPVDGFDARMNDIKQCILSHNDSHGTYLHGDGLYTVYETLAYKGDVVRM